jgi:hypothetical protein
MIFNNTQGNPEFISEGEFSQLKMIYNRDIWGKIKLQSNENKAGKY